MKFHKCIPPIFSSFRYKLLLAFLIATMVPLISLTFISYHISYNIARDRIIDSAVMTDKQLVSQLNDRLGQVENVADTIQFQMYSLNQPSSNKVDALKKFTTVKNNISLYKSTFDFFHIYVFLQPDQLGSKESLYFFSTDELSAYGLDKNIVSGSGFSSVWIPVSNMPLPKILSTKKSSADVILCVRALKNQATGILEYAYGIALDTSELTTYLQPAALDSRIYSYILTDHGEIAAKNTSSLNLSGISKAQFQKLKGNADSSFHSGDKYYNCCTLSNGWLHVTEIPESYIQGNTHILIRALLITVLIFLLLTVIIVILFSENLTRKITALSYAMEAFQLGYDPEHLSIVTVPHPDDPSRYDEIDRLGITFEDMQHTIAGNLKSIGKLDIADQMIANLTAFYRLTLRKSKELIPIKDELEIARLYLEMEKLCHKDNLDWEIEAEDGIENFLICKFTLQPFLENSILHGISSGTPAVFISIHVLYGDDTVVISIEDNGAGMDSETLAQLRHAIEHNVIDYEKHFGISNVSSRISNPLYGNGSVRIRSNPGNGTYVTIEFEQMEEDIDEKNNDRR